MKSEASSIVVTHQIDQFDQYDANLVLTSLDKKRKIFQILSFNLPYNKNILFNDYQVCLTISFTIHIHW